MATLDATGAMEITPFKPPVIILVRRIGTSVGIGTCPALRLSSHVLLCWEGFHRFAVVWHSVIRLICCLTSGWTQVFWNHHHYTEYTERLPTSQPYEAV